MTNPLFSIITVTKNNLSGLQKTTNSITPQTCEDYEWIVIDGDSNDGTKEFLKTTNSHHISEPDNSLYHAMNKGIKSVNGQYFLMRAMS